ncbi:MAG: glycosyltransferase [Anaerolineae bacterium]|jgi:glycosyltransferase involved in cell wall biosynthesis|nr:glycosyltransferase [Anaerolineae bacterium]
MNLDDVTIVLPTKDEAHNIATFLRSLPSQPWLVVVDSSRDCTPEIVAERRPSRTLVVRQQVNVTHARQLGARVAETPWILFTDADVVFGPSYFSHLRRWEGVGAVYGPKASLDVYAGYYSWFARGQRLLHFLGIPAASGSNLLVSREVFWAVGGFDLRLTCNEDSELAFRIARRGFRVCYDRDLVVYERDHRRLRRGVMRKTAHTLVRCSLLYLGLMPEAW